MSQLLQEKIPESGPRPGPESFADPVARLAFHRVILYSPHPLLRAGLRAELAAMSDFKVVGETGSPTELLEMVSRTPVSLLIFDPTRPGETLRLVRAIQQRLKAPIPMITLNGETTGQAAQLKSLGVILADKEIDSQHFREVVEMAVYGRRPLPGIRFCEKPVENEVVLKRKAEPEVPPVKALVEIREPAGKLPLSPRELQILGIIGQGSTNKEVAETLCISSHTLKNHLNNIFKKLAVEDRTQALMVCVRRGWVTL